MTKRSSRLTGGIAALALLAAACGGGDLGTTDTTPPSTEAAATTIPPTSAPPATLADTTTTAPPTTMAPLPALTLDLTDFPTLAGDVHYEGWAIIDGTPVTTGKFDVEDGHLVDLDGNPVDGFDVDEAAIVDASAIVITIEPAGDTDAIPSDTHIAAGDVVDGSAALTIAHPAALGTDFSDASGRFVLATPTDSDTSNELSGIWFLTLPGPEAGLTLPTLPAGWHYEGWVVIDGTPVSTGRFTDVAAADLAAPFSGDGRMPPFPGEDFLRNAPDGLTFPTDLSGATAVISVEPDPDDDAAPFALKPLAGDIPADAEIEPVAYDLAVTAAATPTGTATINR